MTEVCQVTKQGRRNRPSDWCKCSAGRRREGRKQDWGRESQTGLARLTGISKPRSLVRGVICLIEIGLLLAPAMLSHCMAAVTRSVTKMVRSRGLVSRAVSQLYPLKHENWAIFISPAWGPTRAGGTLSIFFSNMWK